MRDRELEVLQHSLGLDQYGRGSEYRNRFVTGPGCADFATCSELAELGLMRDHGVHPLCGGSHFFTVTDAGRAYVREHSPSPPKLSRSQRRYQDFLDMDSGLSFGEWLQSYGRQPSNAKWVG